MRADRWLAGCAALLAASLTLAVAPSHAAEPLPLTVEQAVERALARSEEAQLARAQSLEARGRVREALAGALPQVTGTLTYWRQFDSIFSGLQADSGLASIFSHSSFGAAKSWNVQLEASQLLWDGGKVLAAHRGARLFLGAARAEERETASDIAYQVKSAYYGAVAAGRLVEIAEDGLARARDHMNQVALFHREGTRAEYDLLRAQVDAANQEPAVVAARTGYQIALLSLKRLVNLPLDQPIALATALESDDGTIPVPTAALDQAPSRGALAAAEANVGVQEQVLRAAHAESWPTLDAKTTISHQAFPQGEWASREDFRRSWQAEIRMSFPIFTGFRAVGQAERARADLLKARAESSRLHEQVAIEVAEARAAIERAQSVLAARRETVRQAERAHELAGVRYQNGISTELEVSDARLAMQTAQVRQVEASRDYLVALAGLERALGHAVPVERKPLDRLTLVTPDEKTEGAGAAGARGADR